MELLTGDVPYTARQRGCDPFIPAWFVYQLGHDETLVPTLPMGLSASALSFVSGCLERDETKRPTVEMLLAHEFLL